MWSPLRRYATDVTWSNFAVGWPDTITLAGTPYAWTVA